jgi:hypothetical protein
LTQFKGKIMHHLLGYFIASGGAITDAAIQAMADDVFSRSGTNYQIPKRLNIPLAYAGSATMTRARVETPKLRQQGFPYIVPFQIALLPPTDPNLMDFREKPLEIIPQEDLRVSVSTTASENMHAFLWVTEPNHTLNVNPRDLHWIRFTSTITTVANAWSAPTSVTLADTLEGGRYDVYGLQVFFATSLAARLVFPDQQWRPGCLGMATGGLRSHEAFRGGLGKWGSFDTYSLFQIQAVDNAAAAVAYECYVLVAKQP